MTCDLARELLDAYADNELDLVRAMEFERHVESCERCAAKLTSVRSLSEVITSGAPRFRAPDELRTRILAELRGASNGSGRAEPVRIASPWRWRIPLAIAAAILLAVASTSLLIRNGFSRAPDDAMLAEVVSAHLRSLMADHLTDVASTDRHTVAPWFQGKLDFAPTVRDFVGDGFALTGGRLEYLGDRPAASLVYRHGAHVINLFVRPTDDSTNSDFQTISRRGLNIVTWTQNGLSYWAVSNTSPEDLRTLANLVRTPPGSTPSTEPAATH